MKPEHKKIEFIYWFAYYNLDSPSVRYRAKYPLEFFKAHKEVGFRFVVPGYQPKNIIAFISAYMSALLFRKRNSLIVIQRVQSRFIYALLLKLLVRIRRQGTVYDLDDADYLDGDAKTIYFFAKHCEKLSVGSKLIEKHFLYLKKPIVHTTSPIVDLRIVKSYRSEIFTIGWIGGFGGDHKTSLIELVFPALKELSFPFRFVVIGVRKEEDIHFINNYFKDIPAIDIVLPLVLDWNDEMAIQEQIVKFDLGIATLTDSELQLSKSGIKAKQYMNNGVPVLSTNLPENNSVVQEGINGFFCNTSDDFIERINQFYHMKESDYFIFSENARKTVVHFDHNHYFVDFVKIMNV